MERDLKVEPYIDDEGQHRWQLIDPSNGLIVGAATQGFTTEEDMRHNIALNLSEDYRRIITVDGAMVIDLSNGMAITPDTA